MLQSFLAVVHVLPGFGKDLWFAPGGPAAGPAPEAESRPASEAEVPDEFFNITLPVILDARGGGHADA